MGEQIKIVDLAKNLIALSGLEPARLRKHLKELHRFAQLMAEEKLIAKMKEIIKLAKQ